MLKPTFVDKISRRNNLFLAFAAIIGAAAAILLAKSDLPLTLASFFLLILIVIFVLVMEFRQKHIDIFNPIFLISFLFFYYYVMPLFDRLVLFKLFPKDIMLKDLFFMELRPEDDYIVFKTVMACILGVFMFYVGYYSEIGRRLASALPLQKSVTMSKFRNMGLTYLFIGATITTLLVTDVGGIETYISLHWARRFFYSSYVTNYLLYFHRLLLITSIISLFVYVSVKKSVTVKILWFMLTVVFLVYFMFEGGRRIIVELIISLLIVRHYTVKRISLPKISFAGALLFLLVPVLDVFRSTVHLGFHEFKRYLLDADISLLLRYNTEYNGAFGVLINVVDKVPQEIDYFYGISFIRPLFAIIPRPIWPEKPLEVSQIMAHYLYPKEVGLSVASTVVGEAYFNLGYAAIIIAMFTFGVFSKAIYIYLQRNTRNSSTILVYACVFPFIFEFLRGPISGGMLLIISQLFLLLPIIKLVRKE